MINKLNISLKQVASKLFNIVICFFLSYFILFVLFYFLPSTILGTCLFYFYSTDITKRAVQIPLTTVAHYHVILKSYCGIN